MQPQRWLILSIWIGVSAAYARADIGAYTRALRLSGEQRHEEALAALKEAIRSDASLGRAYARTLAAYKDLGHRQQAREFFETLVNSAHNPYGHYALALWYRDDKQLAEAGRQARLAIEQTPAFLPAYKEFVEISADEGQLPKSRSVSQATDASRRAERWRVVWPRLRIEGARRLVRNAPSPRPGGDPDSGNLGSRG